MANMQLFRCFIFIAIVFRMSYSDENCGDVTIISPVSNTVNVFVNDWANMTFHLNKHKCSSPAYLITVERKEQNRSMIVCRIHHNQTTCYRTGTETMYTCRCVSPSGPVEFWDKLVRPGDVEYRWRWTDSSGKQGEKKINYLVTAGDKHNGEHLQMMKIILGGVCGLLVVAVAVIFISTRCHKSSPPAATENRKGQHTQLGSAQLTRPNPQTQAGNYRDQTRCNQPSTVEDVYARVVRDPRRKPPASRQVEQQASIDMFINDLYDEKAL